MIDRADLPARDREDSGDPVVLTYRRLLGHRFHVHTWVRAAVAATIVVAAIITRHAFGVTDLDVCALSIVAALIVLYDALVWPLARRCRDLEGSEPEVAQLVVTTYVVIALDFAALTCVLWLIGGARSPFVGFYLLHVIINAVVLSRRAAWSFLGIAYGLVVALVVVEATGVAAPDLPAGLVLGRQPLEPGFAVTLLVAHGMLFGLTTWLLIGVTGSLRQSERRIRLANDELRRLSEQRRDFLRIALHNLKAPVGAVTMFLQNMRDGVAGPVADQHRVWLDRSLQRLGDLTEFMRSMGTLSSIETDIIQTEFGRVDLAKVVEGLVEEYADVAVASSHALSIRVEASVPSVVGSERLLREAVVNYLTNAIKYTPAHGRVCVRVLYRDPDVVVEVEDDGIGIAEEDQENLFREFCRIFPTDPLLPKVEGTGLGLSIVQRIVLAHGGRVGVRSAPGRGSTFFLSIPAAID